MSDDVAETVEYEDDNLEERCWLAAHGQKMVIYSIIANFVLRSAERSHAIPDTWLQALFLCVTVYSLAGILKICAGLDKSRNSKIVYMVLAFVPLINIIALVYLSVRATKMLREEGWEVGLFGART
jgi:hypothetical protein